MENVRLNFSHLCDMAFFSEGGKLNIIGIFKSINSRNKPITHPQMFVVTNFSFFKEGNYEEKIRIIRTKDNSEIIEPLKFNFSTKGSGEKEFGVVGKLEGVRFDEFGEYKVQIFINNDVFKEMPLIVNEIK